MGDTEEFITLTSRKQGNTTTIEVERVRTLDDNRVFHKGAGQHKGLVVNKQEEQPAGLATKPEMQLEFTCLMHNKTTDHRHAENRRLKFWFVEGVAQFHRLDKSYDFFKEIINPETFPSGFIKKVMKQLQLDKFSSLRRVDIDFITLAPSQQEDMIAKKETRPVEVIVRENIQNRLEEAYPNLMSMDDLVRILKVESQTVHLQIKELRERDLIEEVMMEGKFQGQKAYRRKVLHLNEEVKMLKGANHFQQVSQSEKPTIAVITNLLAEKMAVDSMLENKTTFVRLKTEGESHVYTIGNIGPHKVISTKLPMIGHDLQAKISAGGTTTRLLGAFQEIQHVFVVGVGGSVPHVYEFEKHSRLGDIVISAPLMDDSPNNANKHMYVYCEKVIFPDEFSPPDTQIKFVLKKYAPSDFTLQKIVDKILSKYEKQPDDCQWEKYIQEGLRYFKSHNANFNRPPSDTDRLIVKMGEGCNFEIKHPDVPPELVNLYRKGQPAVRMGIIGSGHSVTTDDTLRDTFAMENQLLSYDAEYDQVLESIIGNRLNSYMFIRGMADYVDGHQGSPWQPYAALAAASFMKAVVLNLPHPKK